MVVPYVFQETISPWRTQSCSGCVSLPIASSCHIFHAIRSACETQRLGHQFVSEAFFYTGSDHALCHYLRYPNKELKHEQLGCDSR